MALPNLPDEDHIVRLVPWSKLFKDEDDNVLGVSAEAFVPRKDDPTLSVNWLERVSGSSQQQLQTAATLIQDTQSSKKIGPKARLARLNVGQTKSISLEQGSKIRIVHAPIEGNEPHSEIRQMPVDDRVLQDRIASDAVLDITAFGDIL